MSTAPALRLEIEAALAHRIPSALTPAARILRDVAPTGISPIDILLEGGFPVGALVEMVGPECSGRTALAQAFVAGMTQTARVCAWIDVSDTFDPESAAANRIDLKQLLWVRCGSTSQAYPQVKRTQSFTLPEKYLVPPPATRGIHGGGCGPHPRGEEKGLSAAVGNLLSTQANAARCAEPQPRRVPQSHTFHEQPQGLLAKPSLTRTSHQASPWTRIEQAMRVTDLLLQGGGFSAVVLDVGSLAPEPVSRIPLATWFRYRAAAERTEATILLLTQHACAKSSAELVLRFTSPTPTGQQTTVFSGIEHHVEVVRRRFAPTNVVLMRKPPQRASEARWHSTAAWAGKR